MGEFLSRRKTLYGYIVKEYCVAPINTDANAYCKHKSKQSMWYITREATYVCIYKNPLENLHHWSYTSLSISRYINWWYHSSWSFFDSGASGEPEFSSNGGIADSVVIFVSGIVGEPVSNSNGGIVWSIANISRGDDGVESVGNDELELVGLVRKDSERAVVSASSFLSASSSRSNLQSE